MLTQAEEGMKLFEAQQGTAAEVGIPPGNRSGRLVDPDAPRWTGIITRPGKLT